MLQGHHRKDARLILAYFSRIQVRTHGREGWMGVSTLSFDSSVQCNIAVGFIFWSWWFLSPSSPPWRWLHQRAAPHPEGLFRKSLSKNGVATSQNQTEQTKPFFSPALKVSYDICWAAVVRLCFGEQTSVSTGTRLLSLWKAQLRDVM